MRVFLLSLLFMAFHLSAQQLDPDFYLLNQGEAVTPWEFSLHFGQQPLVEQSAKTTKGSLKAKPATKQQQGDAISLTWKPRGVKNEWGTEDKNVLTATMINRLKHTDWSLFKDRAALVLDVRVKKAPKKLVELSLECNWDWQCRTTLPLKNALKGLPKNEWAYLPIPLSCFDDEEFDFSKVTTPFMLYTGGKMALDIASIQLIVQDKPIACQS